MSHCRPEERSLTPAPRRRSPSDWRRSVRATQSVESDRPLSARWPNDDLFVNGLILTVLPETIVILALVVVFIV